LQAASPEEFAKSVFSLCRPVSATTASRLAFYSFLAFSFLPLFAREYERVRAAQSFRGAGLGGNFMRRVVSVRLLLVPLILSAIHRSGQLAAVVELRGLKDRIGEVAPPAKPAARDYIFAAVTVLVLVLAIVVFDGGAGA
jgi:energy-coupling factor transport system permease protein